MGHGPDYYLDAGISFSFKRWGPCLLVTVNESIFMDACMSFNNISEKTYERIFMFHVTWVKIFFKCFESPSLDHFTPHKVGVVEVCTLGLLLKTKSLGRFQHDEQYQVNCYRSFECRNVFSCVTHTRAM